MRTILTILRFAALTLIAQPLALCGWVLAKTALGLCLVANWIQENA